VRALTAAAAIAATTLAGGVSGASAASGPFTVANTPVDRLVQSTGNLYWTSHFLNELGPSSATVYRAAKTSTPGAERVLYQETGSGFFYFGDITYPETDSRFGYFVANYPATNSSQIKRVPLAGGTAVPIATSPAFVGLRDLVTDGGSLYWADAGGLRKVPLGGGAVTTLATDAKAGLSVAYSTGRIYYTSGNTIRSVPRTGGASRTEVTAPSEVTAMSMHSAGGRTYLDWGEHNGSVKSSTLSRGGVSVGTTHQKPIANRKVWSVSFDGTRMLWSDCSYPNGSNCAVRKRSGGTTTIVRSGGVGADNVQGDARTMFWADSQLRRYGH
jgi:hypothetical protein